MTAKKPAGTHDDTVKALKEQIEKLTDLAARAQADLQNFKARQRKDTEEFAKFAAVPLLLELLPVRDDLARAAAHENGAGGIGNILAKLDGVLEKAGITRTGAVGMTVDPLRHEVIGAAPGDKDVVLEVHGEGYELHGRVLRPAKVIVGDGS